MKSLLRLSERGFSILAILLLAIVLSAIGFTGYKSIKQRSTLDTSNTNANPVQSEDPITDPPSPTTGQEKPISSNRPVQTQPNTKTFDAEIFYNQIQNDMTYAQVKSLANDIAGDCGTTDVYPDSGRMGCAWSDTSHRVTVLFNQDKVAGKDKARL